MSSSRALVVAGKLIKIVAGYGVELPCKFKFAGDTFSCHWLKDELKEKHESDNFMYYRRTESIGSLLNCAILNNRE